MVWLKRLGWLLLLLVVVMSGLGWMWWATAQSPEFYEAVQLTIADPVERKQVAQEFVEQSQHFAEEMKSLPEWAQEFTETQINAWLVEEFPREFAEWIPPDISQPRVRIQADGLRIGAKVNQVGAWHGIISVHAKVRVCAPNELAIELLSVHAGRVAVPLTVVIDQITEYANENGVQIEWRHEDDRDVGIVRLAHAGSETPQLERLELRDGAIRVSGSSPPQSGGLQFVPERLSQRLAEHDEARVNPSPSRR